MIRILTLNVIRAMVVFSLALSAHAASATLTLTEGPEETDLPKILCSLADDGTVTCIGLDQEFPGEQAYPEEEAWRADAVVEILHALLAEFGWAGNDLSDTAFFACGNNWGLLQLGETPSSDYQQKIVDQCAVWNAQDLARGGHLATDPGDIITGDFGGVFASDKGVDDIVAALDGEFASCQDSAVENAPMAWPAILWIRVLYEGGKQAVYFAAAYEFGRDWIRPAWDWLLENVPDPIGHPESPYYDTDEDGVPDAEDTDGDGKPDASCPSLPCGGEGEIGGGEGEPGGGEGEPGGGEGEPGGGEGEPAGEDEPGGGEDEAGDWVVPGGDSAPAGCGLDVPCNSCADRQAWWEFTRQGCEAANWQTYECTSILCMATKSCGATCPDPGLIIPNPDGDLVCGQQLTEVERARIAQEACESRQGIMQPPDGDSTLFVCLVEPVEIPLDSDICGDPRAIFLPEYCVDEGYLPLPNVIVGPIPLPDALTPGDIVGPVKVRMG